MSVAQTIHAEATGALARLQEKHPGLKEQLAKSHGYAVFPSIGRASAALGIAHGKGEVYERGQPIGFATVSQITIGVQLGGQTYSELLFFDQKPALDTFKRGKVAFAGNASAVLVKAAASGTTNPSTITAHAYSQGGMLIELSLGGQKFSFIPPDQAAKLEKGYKDKHGQNGKKGEEADRLGQGQEGKNGEAEAEGAQGAQDGAREAEGAEGAQKQPSGLASRASRGIEAMKGAGSRGVHAMKEAGSRGVDVMKEAGSTVGGVVRRHGVAATAVALGLTGAGVAAGVLRAAHRRHRATPPAPGK